jgi:hypothetical protein
MLAADPRGVPLGLRCRRDARFLCPAWRRGAGAPRSGFRASGRRRGGARLQPRRQGGAAGDQQVGAVDAAPHLLATGPSDDEGTREGRPESPAQVAGRGAQTRGRHPDGAYGEAGGASLDHRLEQGGDRDATRPGRTFNSATKRRFRRRQKGDSTREAGRAAPEARREVRGSCGQALQARGEGAGRSGAPAGARACVVGRSGERSA